MLVPLLVPCRDPAAVATAPTSDADALVLDLGDGVAGGDREEARAVAVAVLAATGGTTLRIVRVAALSSGLVDGDLDAVMAGAPDAVLLPGAAGAADIQHLGAKLAVREAERDLMPGRTRIVAMAADTARGVLALASLPGAGPRLVALGWDPAALSRSLGVRDAEAAPCRVARGLLLAAAAAAGVPALDAASPDADLARDCRDARRDGFSGKLALRPEQVAAIRAGLGPMRPRTGRRCGGLRASAR